MTHPQLQPVPVEAHFTYETDEGRAPLPGVIWVIPSRLWITTNKADLATIGICQPLYNGKALFELTRTDFPGQEFVYSVILHSPIRNFLWKDVKVGAPSDAFPMSLKELLKNAKVSTPHE